MISQRIESSIRRNPGEYLWHHKRFKSSLGKEFYKDADKINSLKGYMPLHEGEALAKWAEKFSKVGPILEIGTFGGKSAAFLAYGSRKKIR